MAAPLNISTLGQGCSTLSSSAEDIGIQLQRSMLNIKSSFLTDDGRGVDYKRVKDSAEFKEYCKIASSLEQLDLLSLSEIEKKAFFINVYNALTIHGLVHCQELPSSVLELEGFWSSTSYKIGGHIFSLDDIEHGILRCNKPHPGTGRVAFLPGDPRLQFIAISLDPRIHFALVCGAKSCPAIQVYSAEKLERGLNSAAINFCQQEVTVDTEKTTVLLSKIFMWYMSDFAESPSLLLQWISQYLQVDVKIQLQSMLSSPDSINIQYKEYNWLLNKL